MSDRDEIHILFIDNNEKDFDKFVMIQDVKINPDETMTEIMFLGNKKEFQSDREMEKQKEEIIMYINSNFEELDILLLDLLLRQTEEFIINPKNYQIDGQKLLSLEIANYYKQKFKDEGKLIVFTSGPTIVNTPYLFMEFQKNNIEYVSSDWFFVMKPKFDQGNKVRMARPCPEVCAFKNFHRVIKCNSLECVHHQLVGLFHAQKRLS